MGYAAHLLGRHLVASICDSAVVQLADNASVPGESRSEPVGFSIFLYNEELRFRGVAQW
jgi:hypothetical protein